jgi:hypothetical protein
MDLFEKTTTFLKLANTPPANDSFFRETDSDNKMRNYRKRRLKRHPTAGADHFL